MSDQLISEELNIVDYSAYDPGLAFKLNILANTQLKTITPVVKVNLDRRKITATWDIDDTNIVYLSVSYGDSSQAYSRGRGYHIYFNHGERETGGIRYRERSPFSSFDSADRYSKRELQRLFNDTINSEYLIEQLTKYVIKYSNQDMESK